MSHRPRYAALSWLFALAATSAVVGCLDPAPLACTSELRVAVTPRDTTLRIAESVRPTASLSSCGGREQLAASIVLVSQDTAVVRVEAGTQRVRAVGPGTARVSVSDSTYGALGDITIRVTPTP